MREINFEGLNLKLNVPSVLFEFYGIKIYFYGFFIVLGIILGLILCKKDDGKYSISFDTILELLLFVLPISIISARIYFVLFKLNFYLQNPLEIVKISNGGLAIYGGIIGGILTIICFCKIKKIRFIDILDYLAPYLALGQAIGRWGNFFNGEAHGIETTSILRMGIYENGKYIQVHPTFLYESICTFIIFIILYLKRNKRKSPGEITCIYFALYGFTRAIIESLRADSLMFGPIRISLVLSIILCITSIIILLYIRRKKWEKK